MPSKRSRTIDEKILECLDDKVKNLHPKLRKKLINDLKLRPEANNVSKCKKYVTKLLDIPEMGNHTKKYWLSRGWSENESYLKSKTNCTGKRISVYSREFWISRINPETGINYTIDEADYERNSRRPIRKEYWIKLGYLENEAEQLAIQTKNSNNIKGSQSAKKFDSKLKRKLSKRCIEYWINLGYSEIEAKEKVSRVQSTFSLEKCIEKYGEEYGRKRWLERQVKWHKSYKKSNFSKISQELFWSISEKLESLDSIYFAELGLNKKPDYSGTNNEYRLKIDRLTLPDFIDIKKKKIIEFNGVYWHGEVGRGNKKRDEEKIKIYASNGYEVLTVCENEYKKNKSFVIEKCINFLKW